MKSRLVKSIEELKEIAGKENGRYLDFYISLGGGLARSSKQIAYHRETDRFDVINEIDSSFQENLSEKQLKTKTNIVEAIEKKALYQYLF